MKPLCIFICLMMLVSLTSALGCCESKPPNQPCVGSGSCSYTCTSGWYNCDGSSTNGCETNTPCGQYAFHRFTFNLSDYDLSSITNLTYCFDGLYVESSAVGENVSLRYYNVTSGSWVYDQSITTSKSVLCKSFTSADDIVNSTSKIFQFAARGYLDSGTITIYTDNVNLSITGLISSQGSLSWSSGRFGYALGFDGTVYANVSDSSSLNITGNALTLSAWIKVAGPPGGTDTSYYQIVGKDSSAVQYRLLLSSGRNNLLFQAGGAVGNSSDAFTALALDTWHHVAVSWNGTNANYYLDGVSVGSPIMSSTITGTTDSVQIGKTFGTNYYFNGTIDEIAIYSRAKSAEEIAADANPLSISLDVRDSLNNPVAIRGATSGYVNPGGNNTFYLKMNENGSLNMTVGAYSGLYSLRAYINNARANLLIKTIQEGVSSMQAILPLELQICQQLYKNLIIAEK